MRFYNARDKNYGFIILSPDHNVGLVQSTIYSIQRECKEKTPYICITGADVKESIAASLSALCPTFQGNKTITSLMNVGLQKSNTEWNIFIFEGSQVEIKSVNKLFYFAEDKKNILYPIVINYGRQNKPINILFDFDKSTMNGLTIHRDAFKEIGKFTDNPIPISKLFWQMDAIEKGYKFKAILGAKMI